MADHASSHFGIVPDSGPHVIFGTVSHASGVSSVPFTGLDTIPAPAQMHHHPDQGVSNPSQSGMGLQKAYNQPTPSHEQPLAYHGIASGYASQNDTAAPTVEELRAFAQDFKIKRIKLGFTQKQVGEQLEDYGGPQLSQTTICRFEAQQLSENNRVKIHHILRRWCDGVASSNKQPLPPNNKIPSKRRKKRTSIDSHVRAQLDERFSHHPKPSALEIGQLAAQVGLAKEVVRVWFCNRRQKERRGGAGLADNQQ